MLLPPTLLTCGSVSGTVRGIRLCPCLSLSVGLIVLGSFPYCNKRPELSPLNNGKGLCWRVGSVCGHMAQCSRPLVHGGCGQRALCSLHERGKGLECQYPFPRHAPRELLFLGTSRRFHLCPSCVIDKGQILQQVTLWGCCSSQPCLCLRVWWAPVQASECTHVGMPVCPTCVSLVLCRLVVSVCEDGCIQLYSACEVACMIAIPAGLKIS